MDEISFDDLADAELRRAWWRYLDRVKPFRPRFHAYCRRLTGNLWDAEDLVQEALIRGFHALAADGDRIRNPRAYLLQTASRAWIERLRRQSGEARSTPTVGPSRERAAVLLADLFDMSRREIAAVLATTPRAVEEALSAPAG